MNAIVEHRPEALGPEDYQKLDTLAGQSMSFKPRYAPVVKTKVDEYGDRVEYRDYVPSGYEVFPHGEINQKLLASLLRPTVRRHTAVHLAKLADHKPFGRGLEAWKTIVYDLCNDLEGVSEYAIIKICEKYRREHDTTFFPDTGGLLKDIRDFDFSLRNVGNNPQYKPSPQAPVEEPIVRTSKSKRRVGLIIRIGMRPEHTRTKWEKRWVEAMGRKKS